MGLVMLCLVCFLAMLGGEAGASRAEEEEKGGVHSPHSGMGWPGYLYTRTYGRCTPQFWSSGREAWPNVVPQEAAIAKVFGSRVLERYEPGLTLLEATQRNDDVGGSGFAKLVKQASAALLNAYTRTDFPYNAWEVKNLLLEAIVSEQDAAHQGELFEQANHACP